MSEVENVHLLDEVENQITNLVKLDRKNWTSFYFLLKEVEEKKLWEEFYNSFSQWVKVFAVRNQINESILWQRKKAGEIYQIFSEIQKANGIDVDPLDKANVSADSLILLEKITRNDNKNISELAEKVFNNEITRQELRDIYNSIRNNQNSINNKIDASESKYSILLDNININTKDILSCLFETDKWIGAKRERVVSFSSIPEKREKKLRIKTLTEFAVYTGADKHSERIDLVCVENFNTNLWDLNIHGVEVKISENDLVNDQKYIEYKDFVDFLWLAVPKELQEIAQQNIFNGCGLIVIDKEKNNGNLTLEVIKKPKKLKPTKKNETYKTLILKLI
ncbi:MAG: MmcB family DNA repair protein [Fusobacterium sp.]|nr:MmcB family DNA repair protein [Fusobacterium sp.]